MAPKVIQGLFIAGGPRLQMQARPGPLMRHRPGPPPPAFDGHAATAQGHGAHEAFAVDSHQLGLMSGGGQPLPDGVRSKMESALSADFRGVRVHVGAQAARIGAIAFTLGSEIYFAPGRYQPDTLQGQQVLGHELAHVLQQRAGRVRNPLGSGMAVVQDRALEAEADRLGHHAAAHRMPLQPKLAAQPAPVRISPPLSAGPNSYRLTAAAAGRPVGSVMVHAREGGAVEVTDLGVDAAHREHGVGKLLLASAARTAQQLGRTKVTLAAQDNGSGRLVRWYQQMGFAQTGARRDGYRELAAPIARLTAASLQGLRAAPLGLRSFSLQLMKKDKAADERARRKKLEADKEAQSQKAKAKNYQDDPSKNPAVKKASKESELALEKKKLAEEARRKKEKEERELALETRLADETRDFRRRETLARFLETRVVTSTGEEIRDSTNVCVAIAEFKGTIVATTNRGKIGNLFYNADDETLLVDENFTVEKEEQNVATSARKLSAYFAAGINNINQVCQDKSDNMHAEMKMIDYLIGEHGAKSEVTIYISRLCCGKCRRAIDLWNKMVHEPRIIVREGTHGGYFPGWDAPACFPEILLEELYIVPKLDLKAEKEKEDTVEGRGRLPFSDFARVTTQSQRRERSLSPAPKGAKFKFYEF